MYQNEIKNKLNWYMVQRDQVKNNTSLFKNAENDTSQFPKDDIVLCHTNKQAMRRMDM